MKRLLPLLPFLLSACNLGRIDGADIDAAVPPPIDAGADAAPPTQDVAVVIEPLHGAVVNRTSVVMAGFHSTAGAAVEIQRFADDTRTWETAATGVVRSDDTSDGLYPFNIQVDLNSAAWPRDGLVHLRARVNGADVPFFDSDSAPCIRENLSWRDRISRCASNAAAITLVDRASKPQVGDRRFIDAKGAPSAAQSLEYYTAIDAPPTLAAWFQRYGFGANDGSAKLTYYNAGDLATGREMHCRRIDGGGVACCVRNYGVFGTPQNESIDLLVAGSQAGDGTGSFATVCMTYEPPASAPNAVKFIVYGGAAGDVLVTEAQLDTQGHNKAVPANCINCHGSQGSYDIQNRQVRNARFLPFDPDAFIFPDVAGFRRADQEDAMRRLNEMMLATEPPAPMAERIRGWYGDSGNQLSGPADTSFVPPGWRNQAQVYRHVIAPVCAGCHTSFVEGPLGFRDAQSVKNFGPIIGRLVCNPGPNDLTHAMPNAEASLGRFWTSSARAYLAGFLGPEAMGSCTP